MDSDDAHRPVVQKYAVADWVPGLLADPTSSVPFTDDDTWNYYVPARPPAVGKQPVRTAERALFQPVQSLFYAVLIELCLAGAQFTPAGAARDVALRFVVRRERVAMPPPGDVHDPQPQQAYRDLAQKILRLRNPDPQAGVDKVTDEDLRDLLSAPAFIPSGESTVAYQKLLHDLNVGREAQALTGGPDGPWTWTPIQVADPFALVKDEREYPMWRVLPAADAKGDDKERCLWFGSVPTDGPFLPPGPPDSTKADHRWTYTLTCLAHQAPPADMPTCPARTLFSAPFPQFRLAPSDMKRGPQTVPV